MILKKETLMVLGGLRSPFKMHVMVFNRKVPTLAKNEIFVSQRRPTHCTYSYQF